MTATTDVLDLVGRWAEAEQGNDAEALDGVLAGDFVGVGPLGFVLDRQQWLARFANGLENRAFVVQDAQVRDYGDAAAVVGVLAQENELPGPRQLRPLPPDPGRRPVPRPLAAGQRPHRAPPAAPRMINNLGGPMAKGGVLVAAGRLPPHGRRPGASRWPLERVPID